MKKREVRKIVKSKSFQRKVDRAIKSSKRKGGTLFNLTFDNFISDFKVGMHFPNPNHGSESGKNCSITKNYDEYGTSLFPSLYAHCWRCGYSFTPIQYLALLSGEMTCNEVGTQHHSREKSKNHKINPSKYYKTVYYAWIQAIKMGLIPSDEKIPVEAIQHRINIEGKYFIDTYYASAKDYSEIIKKLNEEGIQTNRFGDADDFDYVNFVFKKYAKSKDGNVDIASEFVSDFIIEHFHILTTRLDKSPLSYYYDGTYYIDNGKTYTNEICKKIMREKVSPRYLNLVHTKIEILTYIDQDELYSVENPYEIPVLNGILNLRTKKLSNFTPEKIFFSKINASYNNNAQCPNFMKHLSLVLKDETDILIMQEVFGFCLVRDYFLEFAIMLEGSGRNGKGKTLKVLETLLGSDSVSHLPIHQIRHEGFFTINLNNKLANICGDIDGKLITDTDAFKMMTGRDVITANRKGTSFLNFLNYAKILFACNKIPRTIDESDGFFERWIAMSFPFKFVKKEVYELSSNEEKKKLRLIDPNIVDKLTTPEELNGILNWAVEGLQRLLKKKAFTENQFTKDIRNMWLMKSDSFRFFAKENLEEADISRYIRKKELKKHYEDFCRQNRIKDSSPKRIKQFLQDEYNVIEKQISGGDRAWLGIKWVNDELNESQNIDAESIQQEIFDNIKGGEFD